MPKFEDPELFRTILDSLQTGVYVVDREQKILFWNDGAERITGYLRQDVVGRFCRDNIVAQSVGNKGVLPDAADALASVLRDGKPAMAEITLRHKAGHRIPVRLRAVPIRDGSGAIVGAAESFDETVPSSGWERRQTKLGDYGCLDPTTGVLSQGFLQARLRENLATFAEYLIPFSILCIELDRLDQFKSSYGPAAIPPILCVVAQTLENSLRPTDFLGRYGEAQFLAILGECSNAEIEKVSQRLKRMVNSSEISWWGDKLSVTSSFGGTTVKAGDSMESLLKRVENAIHESVEGGGNRVTVIE